MAPFNKRQIGYIQAIAGRQQHRTLIAGSTNDVIRSTDDWDNDVFEPKTLETDKVCIANGTTWTNLDDDAKSLLMYTWNLDQPELGFDSRDVHNNNLLEGADFTSMRAVDAGWGNATNLNVFNSPVKGFHALTSPGGAHGDVNSAPSATGDLERNEQRMSSIHRLTQDGYLNSTHVKFRFTLPRQIPAGTSDHPVTPMGQEHFEFRWIVWRSKLPTMHHAGSTGTNHTNLEAIRDGCSFRNPGYDFFMGQTGRKRGFLGWTLNKDLDKEKIITDADGEAYVGWRNVGGSLGTTNNPINPTTMNVNGVTGFQYEHPAGEAKFTVDDLMTMRINKDDYVVMKDVRFFLGKEHGKSHFEDTLHWDWNDPIDTPDENVLSSPTLNNKNYRWHMTILGTSGGKSPCHLNYSCRWTTKMESG